MVIVNNIYKNINIIYVFILLFILLFILGLFIIINNFGFILRFENSNSYANKLNIIESYNNQILFYKKQNLYNILKKDEDNYFKSFSITDLKVRKINEIDEYYEILEDSLCDPDEKTINKVKDYIVEIKRKINGYMNNNINNYEYEYVNLKKFNEIPWKIGFVCNQNYENGLPHTRGNIIILNKNKLMLNGDMKNMKTLIHEQIHIYQKMYPLEVDYYLKKKHFTKIKKKTKYDNIRANPDLNDYIYKDNDNNVYKAVYNINPNSIEDIVYYPQNKQLYEHPNERMAIEFESILNK